MATKQTGLFNLKIHYIWTFASSFLFLSPIITIYYVYHGLNIQDIVLLTAIYNTALLIFEIPTSTLGDNWSREKTMLLSVIISFLSILIYFFIPTIPLFYLAIIFTALGEALWSGTGHSKLQEDLKAAGLEDDFGKVLGRLQGIERFGSLLIPIFIFFILKYFPTRYDILAGLDIILRTMVIYFVFRFKKIKEFEIIGRNTIRAHLVTIKQSLEYLRNSRELKILLLIVVLGSDVGFLGTIILPVLKGGGVADYINSLYIWLWTGSGIVGSIVGYKIANKFGKLPSLSYLTILKSIFYLIAGLFFELQYVLVFSLVMISFCIYSSSPIWNHILADYTNIQQKATTRSLFLSILGLYNALLLLIFSILPINITLIFLFITVCLGGLIGIKNNNN